MRFYCFSILISFLFSDNMKGQDNAISVSSRSDSIYLKAITELLNEKLVKACPISVPSWETGINAPRSILFYLEIEVEADGSIGNVETVRRIFQYNNSRGNTVKDSLYLPEVFKNVENCLTRNIMNLKYVEPIMVDGEKKKFQIPYLFSMKSL